MISLAINYRNEKSELCEMGEFYDTDKSPLRKDVTDTRHAHAYTPYYSSLFLSSRGKKLNICEIGIGPSLLMWQEYFWNSIVYGFDYNQPLLDSFKNKYNTDRILLSHMDVREPEIINNSFEKSGVTYDLIIDDATQYLEDQLNVIRNAVNYLNPGGFIIVEDIYTYREENEYIEGLGQEVLSNFQKYYFIELNHTKKYSGDWKNDKLFILVKKGADPIFTQTNF
jgi:SAM-dependent methyltransferase